MNDFSIDIETLSTHPNAAILSIGAVQFDRDSGKIGKMFYVELDLDDTMKHGHVSGSTLAWWRQQGEDAKALFNQKDEGGTERVNVHAALCRLKSFILGCSDDADVRVWGNGPTADITWLDSAFVSAGAGMSQPWKFWNVRCVRTTADDGGITRSDVPEVSGPAHHALVDALQQAYLVIYARAAIKGKKPKSTLPAGFEMPGFAAAVSPLRAPGVAAKTRYFRNDAVGMYFRVAAGEALPAEGTCAEVGKPEFDASNRVRYWEHPESGGLLTTKPGEFPTGFDGEACVEIDKARYDELNDEL